MELWFWALGTSLITIQGISSLDNRPPLEKKENKGQKKKKGKQIVMDDCHLF
jgi:hypothetical protein